MDTGKTIRGVTRLVRAGGLLIVAAIVRRVIRSVMTTSKSARDGGGASTRAPARPRIKTIVAVPPRGTAVVPADQRFAERFRAALRPSWLSLFKPTQRRTMVTPAKARLLEPGGSFLAESYTNPAGTRAYKLYVPAIYQGQSLPLVVMLHGCTQTPDDFAAGTRMNVLAEEFECFVLYPAQTPVANSSRCWNWFMAADQERGRGEPSLIAGITRHVMKGYPVDKSRVYVAGLSAGGAMAAVMAMTYSDIYAAAGIHSGLPYAVAHDIGSAVELMKEGSVPIGRRRADGVRAVKQSPHVVPSIVFHGDRDTTVHPRNADELVARAANHGRRKANGDAGNEANVITHRGYVPAGHAYTRTIYHDTSGGQSILEQWRVHGAAHAWSGGSPSGSNTDPKGPDASREMMRFFYEHSRPPGKALLHWLRSAVGIDS